jgi:hypothetical protein
MNDCNIGLLFTNLLLVLYCSSHVQVLMISALSLIFSDISKRPSCFDPCRDFPKDKVYFP